MAALTAIGLIILLATLPGQRVLVDVAGRLASGPGARVAISGLEGSLFASGRIAQIDISDAEGPWLVIRGVAFSWRPVRLLDGVLEFGLLKAASVTFERLPEGNGGSNRSPGKLDLSFSLPFGIELKTGTIDEIRLGAAVSGVEARLAAAARLSLTGSAQDISGSLDIRRIDGRGGSLTAKMDYAASNGRIDASIDVAEPSGGIVATLLDSPGQKPLGARVIAQGTFNDLDTGITLASNDKPFAIGRGQLRREGEHYRWTMDLDGFLTPVLPAYVRDVLSDRTRINIDARFADQGKRITLSSVALSSGALKMTASGGLDTTRSFLHGLASIKVGRDDGRPVQLPLPGTSAISVVAATARVELGEQEKDRPLNVSAVIDHLDAPAHGRIERVQIDARAMQREATGDEWLDFGRIETTVDAVNLAVVSEKEGQTLIVPRVALTAHGRATTSALIIEKFRGTGAGIDVSGRVAIDADEVEARLIGSVAELSVFSGIAGRQLGGEAEIELTATAGLSARSATASLRLTVTDLHADVAPADRLLRGTHVATAELRLDGPERFYLRDIKLHGDGISGHGRAEIITGTPSLEFEAAIEDLSRIDRALGGRLIATAVIGGTSHELTSGLDLRGDAVTLHGLPVSPLTASARSSGNTDALSLDISYKAAIDGTGSDGRVRISNLRPPSLRVDDVVINYGKNRLTGWLELDRSGVPAGDLVLEAPALEAFSSLTGSPISGRLSAILRPDITLAPEGLQLTASAEDISYKTINFERLDLKAAIADLLGNPFGHIRLGLSDGSIGAQHIAKATLDVAAQKGQAGRFQIAGRRDGASLDVRGSLQRQGRGALLLLDQATIQLDQLNTVLAAPARVVVQGDSGGQLGLVTSDLRFSVGSGYLVISADTVNKFALHAKAVRLPLSLVDLMRADLGARGELNGDLSLTGTAAQPAVSVKAIMSNASLARAREAGIQPIVITAEANYKSGTADLDVRARGTDGLVASIQGKVQRQSTVGLDLKTSGRLPLSLLNAVLAERGTKAEGFASIEGTVRGTIAAPEITATAIIREGAVTDVGTGLRLTKLTADARLTGQELIFDRLVAQALPGGQVSASGRVRLSRDSAHPFQGEVRASGLQLNDRNTMSGALDAALTVAGALGREARISGEVALKRFDIVIPELPPRAVRELDIAHVNVPAHRRDELAREDAGSQSPAGLTPITLDIRIVSNDRIFVRGRGLDSQLGGGLRLSGDARSPSATGSFRMIRGRLAIIGRQLNFNHGAIGFDGSIDPTLNFEATTSVDGITIVTRVTGRASEPKITLTSSPELPEDEVFARLLFNKSIAKLSPLQIAQLAAEVDRLGGLGGGSGILEQLRQSVGVDTFDVGTDKKGNATVSAGKYIAPNIYVGAQQNTAKQDSQVVIDLEITRNIKARGETGSNGQSKVGIGVEWNY